MQIGHVFTTPFGRRRVTLCQLAAQISARDVADDASVEKWKVFRDLCSARERLGLSDRALMVLNALLTFYPDAELSEANGLIVFPSNAQLSLRAHGMAPATLRRHLSALIEAGLIVRKDSANGKRFSRKPRFASEGEGGEAFGFNIAPLIARSEEFAAIAAEVRVGQARIKHARERLTIVRRNLVKLIELGFEVAPEADWQAFHTRFRATLALLPRAPTEEDLELVLDGLECLHLEISKLLETLINSSKTSATESHFERHKQNSNIQPSSEFEPRHEDEGVGRLAEESEPVVTATNTGEGGNPERERQRTNRLAQNGGMNEKPIPLGLVVKACPDIADYARGGIETWRDLMGAAVTVRSMLGVSPSAYEEACVTFGQEGAAIIIACILQRASHINSAGGYLRGLTEKAKADGFSIWPMLLAQLRANGGHLAVVANA